MVNRRGLQRMQEDPDSPRIKLEVQNSGKASDTGRGCYSNA